MCVCVCNKYLTFEIFWKLGDSHVPASLRPPRGKHVGYMPQAFQIEDFSHPMASLKDVKRKKTQTAKELRISSTTGGLWFVIRVPLDEYNCSFARPMLLAQVPGEEREDQRGRKMSKQSTSRLECCGNSLFSVLVKLLACVRSA